MKIKELNETSLEARAMSIALDDFSKILHKIEDKLEKENKYKLEFEYHACPIEGIFIAWKRLIGSKKKRCRLYIKWVDKDIERPLAELPMQLRLDVAKYLLPFLREFREYLKEKTDSIEDEVAKIKAELECY